MQRPGPFKAIHDMAVLTASRRRRSSFQWVLRVALSMLTSPPADSRGFRYEVDEMANRAAPSNFEVSCEAQAKSRRMENGASLSSALA